MKPFDLEAALVGAPVCTVDGTPVTQLTLFDTPQKYTLIGVIDGYIHHWSKEGEFQYKTDNNDLRMTPEKLKGFVNIYPTDCGSVHLSRAEADRSADHGRIACIDLSQFDENHGLEDQS